MYAYILVISNQTNLHNNNQHAENAVSAGIIYDPFP